MRQRNISIYESSDEDIEELCTFLEKRFDRTFSPEEIIWKYKRLPGLSRSFIARSKGDKRIVAHTGTIGFKALYGGEERFLWQLVDFAAEPLGLSKRLPLVLTAEAMLDGIPAKEDLPWVFGFPSYRHFIIGQKFLGYEPVKPFFFWQGVPRKCNLADSDIITSDKPTKELENLWRKVRRKGIIRSYNFLLWRYFERPDRYYRFYIDYKQGWITAAFLGKEAWLTEVVYLPGKLKPLIISVLDDLAREGIKIVKIWNDNRDESWDTFTALDFLPNSEMVLVAVRGRGGIRGIWKKAYNYDYYLGDWDIV